METERKKVRAEREIARKRKRETERKKDRAEREREREIEKGRRGESG